MDPLSPLWRGHTSSTESSPESRRRHNKIGTYNWLKHRSREGPGLGVSHTEASTRQMMSPAADASWNSSMYNFRPPVLVPPMAKRMESL